MKSILTYVLVAVAALVLGFAIKGFWSNKADRNDSHIMVYELKKLNKLVVAEQQFSEIYSHESSSSIMGLGDLFSFDKKVVLLVDAKVQASYDLRKMQVELDSVNKVIRILSLPEMQLEVFPKSRLYNLEQSRFNQFSKDELNGVEKRAEQHIRKKINRDSIEVLANQQLVANLKDLYFLANTYNWKIEDKTQRFAALDSIF